MAWDCNEVQAEFFAQQIASADVVAVCFDDKSGFLISNIVKPPGVYAAPLTLMIDDFCVKSADLWQNCGKKLLDAAILEGKNLGAGQILVVCGDHDEEKIDFLQKQEISCVSRWFSKSI